MLEISENQSNPCCDGVSRRNFLQIGGLAMGGLTLPQLLRAEDQAGASAKRQKSIIMIHLSGGPSHTDMWDIKEDAPREYRGEFSAINTKEKGVRICEHFSRVAATFDRFTAIRSVVGNVSDHNSFHLMTGRARNRPQPAGGWPAIGSVLSQLEGQGKNGTPPYFGLDSRATGAGFLGAAHNPFTPRGKGRGDLSLNGITTDRLDDRRALLTSFDGFRRDVDSSKMMEGLDTFNKQALGIITSSHVLDALDLAKEDPKITARYDVPKGYRSVKSFLTARRLVEAGARFVGMGWGSWDTHSNNFTTLKKQLPALDIGLSALVGDLHDRGLDKDVSVVVWGEFGRTPKVNGNKGGRDHWTRVMGALMAGGGMRNGQMIGATDRLGGEATSRPVHIQEIIATLYHNVGIGVGSPLLSDLNGRPQFLTDSGRGPIKELI